VGKIHYSFTPELKSLSKRILFFFGHLANAAHDLNGAKIPGRIMRVNNVNKYNNSIFMSVNMGIFMSSMGIFCLQAWAVENVEN